LLSCDAVTSPAQSRKENNKTKPAEPAERNEMAKATAKVKCEVCGCSYAIEKICHSRKEAESWEEYMQDRTGLCSDCLAEQRRKEREKAEAEASEKGLPKLTGSEKQIAWATTIRADILKQIEKYVTRSCAEEKANAIMNQIIKNTSASYWIDHRDYPNIILIVAMKKIAEGDTI
jgi:hypothetical protein